MFISFRREYLDQVLSELRPNMKGRVLDIGGKKNNKRGRFQPPVNQVISWEYLNTDISTDPDYSCSAETIPLNEHSIDLFVMCEVLEHIRNPEYVIKEAYRILKKDGWGIVTMPFLYPIHADPHDYLRWTNIKIKEEFKKAGFQNVEVTPMGGLVAVVYDLVLLAISKSALSGSLISKVVRRFLRNKLVLHGLKFWDRKLNWVQKYITTGFCIIVKK
jgi:SAM-dependent methyltransferase